MFLQMYLLLINTGRDYRMVRGTVTHQHKARAAQAHQTAKETK